MSATTSKRILPTFFTCHEGVLLIDSIVTGMGWSKKLSNDSAQPNDQSRSKHSVAGSCRSVLDPIHWNAAATQ